MCFEIEREKARDDRKKNFFLLRSENCCIIINFIVDIIFILVSR